MKKALLYGIAGSFFFAFTFILNRNMNLSGGSYIWSSSLRYIFTLPLIAVIVWKKHGFQRIHGHISTHKKAWFLWSTIGFGLFYAPISFAGDHGASWLIAASWQITIVMGILMAPLFHKKIPIKNLLVAFFILLGVFLLQAQDILRLELTTTIYTLIPIFIAAISYPLGNRKMMALCSDQLTTLERAYGMTLCSMPFWLVLSIFGVVQVGIPSVNQTIQAFCVAIFSGVIATLLFFKATDLVRDNQKKLAVIESTQAGEVLFTIIGGTLLLQDAPPDIIGAFGIFCIVFGMMINSFLSQE